jgi:hypothetical protein
VVTALTGVQTLPKGLDDVISYYLEEYWPLRVGTHVEVADRTCLGRMKRAVVAQTIAGRLKLRYLSSHVYADCFWCHCLSSLLHPVGWSQVVGHSLEASRDYIAVSRRKALSNQYDPMDSTPDMFPKLPEFTESTQFSEGMKLEAVDPLNLSQICVATIHKVLSNGFLMIAFEEAVQSTAEGWREESNLVCHHVSSPYIFPPGFCERNGLSLTLPRDVKSEGFNWDSYLKRCKAKRAPDSLFVSSKPIPDHGFRVGMKLEAVDLMEPRLICLASVAQVVGRLLRIHFDGWDSSYDQWMDCTSPDIYPIGWCQLSQYPIEGPNQDEDVKLIRKGKKPTKYYGRKRRYLKHHSGQFKPGSNDKQRGHNWAKYNRHVISTRDMITSDTSQCDTLDTSQCDTLDTSRDNAEILSTSNEEMPQLSPAPNTSHRAQVKQSKSAGNVSTSDELPDMLDPIS